MKKSIYCLGLLLIMMLGLSCCKEDNNPNDENSLTLKTSSEMFDCFSKQSWTTEKVTSSLHGTWEWKLAHLSWGAGSTTEQEKGLRITFASNGTYSFTKGSNTGSGTWSVAHNGNDWYVLQTEPFLPTTMGSISICNNQLLFSHLPADGSDNFFVRVRTTE